MTHPAVSLGISQSPILTGMGVYSPKKALPLKSLSKTLRGRKVRSLSFGKFPSEWNVKRGVYVIADAIHKKTYIGKGTPSERATAHAGKASRPSTRKVYKALGAHPENYDFRVVFAEKDIAGTQTAAKVETAVKAWLQSQGYTILNMDNGGGGGTSRMDEDYDQQPPIPRAHFKHRTPRKYATSKRKANGKTAFSQSQTTRTLLQAAKELDMEIIYKVRDLKAKVVGKNAEIGMTTNGERRPSQKSSDANTGKQGRLPTMIREKGGKGQVGFGILEALLVKQDGRIYEDDYIKAQHPTLNTNGGGGGPTSESRAKTLAALRRGDKDPRIARLPKIRKLMRQARVPPYFGASRDDELAFYEKHVAERLGGVDRRGFERLSNGNSRKRPLGGKENKENKRTRR